VSRTVLDKDGPDGSPREDDSRGENEFEEQARFGEGPCKAELADGDVDRSTGFEHGVADQTEGNHMDEEFLVEGCGRRTMPRSGVQGMLEIAIEGLDVPAHVIEASQFESRKQDWIQERGNEAASAKTVSINEDDPYGERNFVVGVFDLAEIIPRAERT